ncbi:MAG: phospho-sugar mutase [Bacteroidales bacterium]|nr:phospho-sugar mutase [Bacteroidales bacterium]
MNSKIDPDILQSASTWLHPPYDTETIQQVQWLIDNDPKELTESFYRHLEFGTGGLRGIMGVGTNRMNKYTVAMATQGLANYIRKMFPHIAQPSVAIAHDCRNNSDGFAQITAEVMTANGIAVYMFDSLRPTPVLSFAVRHFGCQSGIVITASHNPKEYNGYKAYWNDGGQLIAPHDKNVIAEVKRIKGPADVRFDTKPELITVLDEEFDKIYVTKVKGLSLSPEAISRQKDFKLVFTPIHGSTVRIAPMTLKAVGFSQIYGVEAQNIVDGNFPTVHSPNPEEPAALSMAIKKAKEVNADLVMATDPDGDRVGIAVKDGKGDYLLLNGNQAASLLIYYLLHKWKENNLLTGNEFIAKTIVTSELLVDIAAKYGVESYDVLTGFKYIADLIKRYEGKKTFIGGGEESYGYLVGDFVRDKDAVISCVMLAETAAWAKDIGKSMLELLQDLYIEFGFYKEHLLSVTKKGMEGVAEIKALMERYRNHPPQELDSNKVVIIKDYLLSVTKDLQTGSENTIDLPKSDVLQFILEDGSKISIRPSGTEPKIKFYFGVKGTLSSREQYEAEDKNLGRKIDRIISALNI